MKRILAGLAIAALAAGCQSAPGTGGVHAGMSADEKDAMTRADRHCDNASRAVASDPTSPCYIHTARKP